MKGPANLRVAIVLTAAAVALGASGHDDRRLADALGAVAYRELREVVNSRPEGVPATALLDKALEGVAKGAAAERVLEVTREFSQEIATARQVLSGPDRRRVNGAELRAAVSALEAGVPEEGLRALRGIAPERRLTVTFTVAAHLASHGVEWPRAQALLASRLRANVPDSGLAAIPASMGRR